MPRRGRVAAAAAGGALLALSLPAPGLWAFGWVALAPLALAVARAGRPRDAALAGAAAGIAYHAVALHWIYLTCRFARVPVPVALLAWGALAAFLALNWSASAALAAWCSAGRPRALRPLLFAACWTAVASATGRWTPRLAADLLGYTQWPNLAFLQASAWGGPHLLDFALALFNAALAEAWLSAEEGDRAALPGLAAAVLLAGGLWLGGVRALLARPPAPAPAVRLEILQPDVDQYAKWDASFARSITDGFDELLARPRAAPPDLVIWPETALPFRLEPGAPAPQAAAWARRLGAPQLLGVLVEEADGAPSNAAQLVTPAGAVTGAYAKRELVPFGEYVPFRALIPRFAVERWLGMLDQFGDVRAGKPDQPLLDTPLGWTAVTICYEAMFPRWSRADAARGARALVNVTNDGWYKDTWGPRQHFQANVFRAIETRLPVARAGNTGVSAVIDPWGVVVARLELGERGRLEAELPRADPFPGRSFYVRHGDWPGALCLLLVLALAARRPPAP